MVLLAAAILFAASCSRKSESPSPAAETNTGSVIVSTIDGHKLSLDSHDGICRVTSAAGPTDLAIPWPCDFHRRAGGVVRTLQWGQTVVALVETSRPHPEIPGSCKTQIRAIGIRSDQVYVSEDTDTVAQCPPFLWDEQMFKGLFGDKEPGVPASR